MRALRILPIVAAATLPAVLAGCSADTGMSSSDGACAAPTVTVEPDSAGPGATVEVTGVGFVEGCADNPGVEDGTPVPADEETPYKGLAVTWIQGETQVDLASVDADENGDWVVSVTIPDDAEGGTAQIHVEHADGDAQITVS